MEENMFQGTANTSAPKSVSFLGFTVFRKQHDIKKQYIYIMYDKYFRRYKIGITSTIEGRKRTIANSSGTEMDLLGFFGGSKEHEKGLHSELRQYRLKGEWYKADKKVFEIFHDWEMGILTGYSLEDFES